MLSAGNLYVALIHHQVKNKQGDVVTTAITNLDLHDIARTSRTYGVGGYYVVNPMAAQRELAGRILSHWITGFGSEYNPNRGEALSVIRVVAGLSDAVAEITERHGRPPVIVATAAKRQEGAAGFLAIRGLIAEGGPVVLAFGTGWGLTDEFLGSCGFVLEPIETGSGYNHLPVRAAAAIMLDRLLSDR